MQDPNSIFKFYKQKACEFECRLKYASQVAGCVPWDYPIVPSLGDSISKTLCLAVHGHQNTLRTFLSALEAEESLQQCQCMPDCEEVTLETEVDTLDLNLDELCDEEGDWKYINFAMKFWERANSPLTFRLKTISDARQTLSEWEQKNSYTNFSNGLPTTEAVEVCRDVFKNSIAKLIVQMANRDVMQIKKDIKVTFADQLGTIGT
jgi:hypothetical protein